MVDAEEEDDGMGFTGFVSKKVENDADINKDDMEEPIE